ncbi:HAD-IB family phosphatase [Leptotrichia sp. oral taxon 847]|uniref:HAD-IB family phosphatase n=1 Tax=Leptotrichia sp. oral taxon 847 TaxID=1785996 RepID=UPI0007682150|nr:HAD-IB family phosphatase [Leptotrichia sp. oral taxon 847]AMD94957.1 haloacid dehalogenase [Leptotrichia sp. oral taxon 847]
MSKKRIFLIDFDRTISNEDSTDVLLETHNPEFKKDLRKRYKAGKVTIRQFIKEGLSSLNITKDEYIKTLQKKVTIDESFKDFVKSGLEFRIVSAGSRLNVQGSLLGYGIDLPNEKVISNDLKFDGNKITVENPFLDKEKIYGVDKKEAVEKFKKQGYEVIYVGDGPSDYRAMEVADFVLVRKGTRAVKFCSENGINFREFESFSEILKIF